MFTLRIVFTGMTTFKLHKRVGNRAQKLTFVMMDCPTRRRVHDFSGKHIPRHCAFIGIRQSAAVANARPFDIPDNDNDFAFWILDKERITLPMPKSGVNIDPSIDRDIANISNICKHRRMDSSVTEKNPKNVTAIGAQFVLTSGEAKAEGRPRVATFRPVCGRGVAHSKPIKDSIAVMVKLPDCREGDILTLSSLPLTVKAESPLDLRVALIRDPRQDFMTIFAGSTPMADLRHLPPSRTRVVKAARTKKAMQVEVDFELYYDLARKPAAHHAAGGHANPLPHYEDVLSPGPIPGTDRCPPLNGG